jgi:hypothetical protein
MEDWVSRWVNKRTTRALAFGLRLRRICPLSEFLERKSKLKKRDV